MNEPRVSTHTLYRPKTKPQSRAFYDGSVKAWNARHTAHVPKPHDKMGKIDRAFSEGYWQTVANRDAQISKAMDHGLVFSNLREYGAGNWPIDSHTVTYLRNSGRLVQTHSEPLTYKVLSVEEAGDEKGRAEAGREAARSKNRRDRLDYWCARLQDTSNIKTLRKVVTELWEVAEYSGGITSDLRDCELG